MSVYNKTILFLLPALSATFPVFLHSTEYIYHLLHFHVLVHSLSNGLYLFPCLQLLSDQFQFHWSLYPWHVSALLNSLSVPLPVTFSCVFHRHPKLNVTRSDSWNFLLSTLPLFLTPLLYQFYQGESWALSLIPFNLSFKALTILSCIISIKIHLSLSLY